MANSSGRYAPYPSCFIQPDGKIAAQLKTNNAGMMINIADLQKKFYDPMKNFRDIAISGKLDNSTNTIRDSRSKNRTCL
jgi:hypothetical protein